MPIKLGNLPLLALMLLVPVVGTMKFKYNKDGTCTVDGKLATPTSYTKLNFTRFKCLDQFQKFAKAPVCGDPWYDLKKNCLQVNLFKNQELDNLTGVDADMILVFVVGCVKCDGGLTHLEMSMSYFWEGGSLFTDCWKKRNTLKPVEYRRTGKSKKEKDELGEIYEGSEIETFTMPALFWHRVCKGLFSDDDKPTDYQQIQLHVKHNCGNPGGELKSFDVDLPDFVWEGNKAHLKEFLNVELDLNGAGVVHKYHGAHSQEKARAPGGHSKGAVWSWEE